MSKKHELTMTSLLYMLLLFAVGLLGNLFWELLSPLVGM